MSEILTVFKQNVERIAKEKNRDVEDVFTQANVDWKKERFGIVDADRVACVLGVKVSELFEEKKAD